MHFAPQPKPTPPILTRQAKTRDRQRYERAVAAIVKRRDGFKCRVPWPDHAGPVEAAHIDPKGMGGDKRLIRTTTENEIGCCRHHHRSSRGSIHSADIQITKLTSFGADGLLAFTRDGQTRQG